MKTEKLAGVGRSQWFGCFLDHRFGSPFDTKWALTLHMAYPLFCTHIFSCLCANSKWDSASVTQYVLAPLPFHRDPFRNFTGGCCTFVKDFRSTDTGGVLISLPEPACSMQSSFQSFSWWACLSLCMKRLLSPPPSVSLWFDVYVRAVITWEVPALTLTATYTSIMSSWLVCNPRASSPLSVQQNYAGVILLCAYTNQSFIANEDRDINRCSAGRKAVSLRPGIEKC